MASSSSKSSSSRFSTFKGFKLPGGRSPPPLPAKDVSQPGTPLTPNYMRSPSAPPSAHSSASLSPESYSSTFKKSFIRLASSLTPKSPHRQLDTEPPPEPVDDGSISMPWNFQHNVHVDEGYNGLPSTWSTSLADLGYNEEEIEAIQYRRAASRSPSTHPYQFARSPTNSAHSVLLNPPPRSGSLHRQASQVSFRSRKHAPQKSSDSTSHRSDHSEFQIDPPPLPGVRITGHAPQKSIDTVSQHSLTHSRSQPIASTSKNISEKGRPMTPPQKTFRVINGTASPPPAYRSPHKDSLSEESNQPSSSKASNAPPRLSLGSDSFADISSWTESLFSSVSGTSGSAPATSPPPVPYKSSPPRPPVAVPPAVDVVEEESPISPGGPATISQILGGLKPVPPFSDKASQRDSNTSTVTVTTATIVRGVEVATMTRANVVATPPPQNSTPKSSAGGEEVVGNRTPSPDSSNSHSSSFATSSSSSIGSATRPSSTSSRPPVVIRAGGSRSWELDSLAPSPGVKSLFAGASSPNPTGDESFVEFDDDYELTANDSPSIYSAPPKESPASVYSQQPKPSPSSYQSPALSPPARRPSIQIEGLTVAAPALDEISGTSTNLLSPWNQDVGTISPAQRYRGWLSEVLAPLDDFIDDKVDPRDSYQDLREIAEGESGYVYEARVVIRRSVRSSTAPLLSPVEGGVVAIKSVPILPSGSPKLSEIKKELEVMRNVKHAHVLTMDGLYVDLVEDSLWIRMELMERSLADVVGLVEEGLVVQEKVIARFASDIVVALVYLQKLGIAHRDLRSDNMLLNKEGMLKLADFSNAVKVTKEASTCTGIAGVIYWQAPEVRRGPYNPLKADVWSLGATVWEMAQAEPPFSEAEDASGLGDRWPALRQPEIYSRSFHDFLHLCSHPVLDRPDPEALLATPFIRSAARRNFVVQVLADCKSLEEGLQARENGSDSQGTVSQ